MCTYVLVWHHRRVETPLSLSYHQIWKWKYSSVITHTIKEDECFAYRTLLITPQVKFSQSLPSKCCILASTGILCWKFVPTKLLGMQRTLHIEKYDSYPYLAESMRSHHELLWQPARQQYSQNHWFKLQTANFNLFWSQAAILDSHVHEVRQSSISLCINVFGVLSEFISTVCCIATNNYACPSRLFINLVCSRWTLQSSHWLIYQKETYGWTLDFRILANCFTEKIPSFRTSRFKAWTSHGKSKKVIFKTECSLDQMSKPTPIDTLFLLILYLLMYN